MKGTWVVVAGEPHVCPKPGGGLFGFMPKPLGSIWQCDCGQCWRIDYDSNYAGSGWEWVAVIGPASESKSEVSDSSAVTLINGMQDQEGA